MLRADWLADAVLLTDWLLFLWSGLHPAVAWSGLCRPRSSHPRKSRSLIRLLITRLPHALVGFVPDLAFRALCVELKILSVHFYDALLCDASSSSLHNSVFLVSNRFWIVFGILCLVANGISCPLLLLVWVLFFHLQFCQPFGCPSVVVLAAVRVPFL